MIAASFTPQPIAKAAAAAELLPAKVEQSASPIPPTNGTVILAEGRQAVAPALLGKTVRAALEAAQNAGVEIDVVGSGVARAQVPAAGERIPPGTHVMVRFER